jgi:hypothetical protein
MTEPSGDAGVISVLIERFEEQRLPRALEMKERVDQGEKLSDIDLAFLKEVFADARHMKTYIDKFRLPPPETTTQSDDPTPIHLPQPFPPHRQRRVVRFVGCNWSF